MRSETRDNVVWGFPCDVSLAYVDTGPALGKAMRPFLFSFFAYYKEIKKGSSLIFL